MYKTISQKTFFAYRVNFLNIVEMLALAATIADVPFVSILIDHDSFGVQI